MKSGKSGGRVVEEIGLRKKDRRNGEKRKEAKEKKERMRPKWLLKIINLVGICVSEQRRHKELSEQHREQLSDPNPIG